MTVASLSFRFSGFSLPRNQRKTVHGIGWLVAALSASIALIAVFKSHNDKISGYIANMYSFHSWMGFCVMVFYIIQFLVGAYSFWWSSSSTLKAVVLQIHVLVGPVLYISSAATILLGIQEKEGFVGCSYKVETVELFPRFGQIPSSCLVSHTLGLLVFLTMVTTLMALHNTSDRTRVQMRRD